MSDGVIGSVGVAVVPDATDFWRRFKAQTEAGSKDAEPTVKVKADTSEAEAKLEALKLQAAKASSSVNVKVNSSGADQATFEMHALRDAILLLGPSLVPIAGVATGVLAGLAPVAAALVLGVKGVSAEFKSGSLAGTQYAADIDSVRSEYQKLQSLAAGGLLTGLDSAVTAARPEFSNFNTEIQNTSSQLGDIAGHVVPGLLAVLNQLSPLFTTIGANVDSGAADFERWADSTGSIQKFVAYAQAELPVVEHDLAELFTTVGHLAVGFNPFGSTALRSLTLVSTAINHIPIGTISQLETAVLSGYAAWRTYGAVSGIVNRVNAALAVHAAATAATSATVVAASRTAELAAADEATRVAAAKAQEAAAFAAATEAMLAPSEGMASLFQAEAVAAGTASAEITASFEGVASLFATEASLIAESAAAEAEAFQLAAAAAATSAEEIAASSATVAASQKVAGAGWTAALGPVGALAVGVGLLSTTLFGNSKASETAAQAADSYATSVKSSTDAMSSANIAQTNKNLSDKGALSLLSDLTKSTNGLGISNLDLALAVNGTAEQYENVTGKLKALIAADESRSRATGLNNQLQDAKSLLSIINTQRTGLQDQILTQTQLNLLNEASIGVTDSQAKSQAALFGLIGTTGVGAYLTAEQAAKSNTDQTKAQTLAYQLANNAASLFSQTLQGLAGDNLSVAQAQTSVASANLGVTQSFKQNGDAIKGSSAAAVANQQAIQGNVTAAQQLADAVGKQTGSSDAAVASFAKSKKALEDQLAAQHELTPAVQTYIDQLYNISNLHVPPTKLDANKTAAEATIRSLQADIAHIHQDQPPTLKVETADAVQQIAALQVIINSLQGKTVSAAVVANATGGGIGGHHAAGGSVADGYFTVGEQGGSNGWELGLKQGSNVEIFSNAQSKMMTGLNSVPGYAAGTNPTFTGAGGIQYASQLAATNSFTRAATALDKATAAFLKVADNAQSTDAQLKTAITAEVAAAKKAGESSDRLAVLNGLQKQLLDDGKQRDAILAKLGTKVDDNTTAYQKYANDLQSYNQEISTVSSALTGLFNVQTASTDLTPLQQARVADSQSANPSVLNVGYNPGGNAAQVLLNQGLALGTAKTFSSNLSALEKLLDQAETSATKGLTGKALASAQGSDQKAIDELIQQLAENPSQSAATVAALAKGTAAQIAEFLGNQVQIDKLGAATGTQTAKILDGAQLVTDQAEIAALKAQTATLTKAIEGIGGQVAKAINGAVATASANSR